MLAAIAPVLIFIAFLLLLLVSLSVPITKTIYLFRLVARVVEGAFGVNATATGSARFGVWGYCVSPVDVSALGHSESTVAECSKAHLGLTFDSTLASALHVSNYQNLISRATTAVFVLHPIACGLAFLALLASLLMVLPRREPSRGASILTLLLGILAAFVTTVIFLVDVIGIAIVRSKVHSATSGELTLSWGNAVWMVLGATIALWLSLLGACAGICGHRRRRSAKGATY
ncbi:hypothetical protein JAAARDRAFT_31686 [Jaapia argillacea MUCL 33604]|uniref:Pali-domain-containing protein n=1 Tax=Jaapia argillacea MUCL 33604 TaxID=933084 RepID=A0A067Q3H2_9AGAM|nr:hypothetical protein JAAARDRAFT_31686 [Jaapia argillacea MUCL 33604]